MKWIFQLCKGVESIHQLKLVHRDLKSENVFIAEDDTLKIGDFGLAKIVKKKIQENEVNFIIIFNDVVKRSGTRHYMAPEIMQLQEYLNMILFVFIFLCYNQK